MRNSDCPISDTSLFVRSLVLFSQVHVSVHSKFEAAITALSRRALQYEQQIKDLEVCTELQTSETGVLRFSFTYPTRRRRRLTLCV